MRVRNLKNKDEILSSSKKLIDKNYKKKYRELFLNDNEIHLEIGMGKGKFIKTLALNNPNINYIGVEKNPSILAKAIDDSINNLYYIRCDAKDLLDYFDKDISKIYLNFSDPWPKKRHYKRRLTSLNFLKVYEKISKNIDIEMKTDNDLLFEYSLLSFKENNYIVKKISYNLHEKNENIYKTEYEDKFINEGILIKYVHVQKTIQ